MKKFLAGILVAVMLFTMTAGGAVYAADSSAQESKQQVVCESNVSFSQKFVARANSCNFSCNVKMDKNEIRHAINLKIVEAMVDVTNYTIVAMVRVAQNMRNPDIDALVSITNKVAQSTIKAAADMGIEVICEYEAYEINGEIVYIDPIRVIG